MSAAMLAMRRWMISRSRSSKAAQRAVAARAADPEAQLVARGHVLPGAKSQRADFELRLHVLADHRPDVVLPERALGQHQRGASGVALLAGLEQPEERAAEVGIGGQALQDAEEHRRVHVVSAGVHHSCVPGAVRQSGPLGDRQGVDVGAQHHGPPVARRRPASRDACQNARPGYRAVFDAQLCELFCDECRRAVLPEREFGMRVQPAAEFDGCHFVSVWSVVSFAAGPSQKRAFTICWMLVVRLIV